MRLLVAGSLVLGLSAFQLRSRLLDIWRDKKNYLPFLAYAILGIFSVQFFFYLCVEYSNATTATILQFISPVFYPVLQSNHLPEEGFYYSCVLCFDCHARCFFDGYKRGFVPVIHDTFWL